MFSNDSFDIRNFARILTPVKEKNRYVCPVCGGNNLTINQKSGAYQCWNGCLCVDIKNTLVPNGQSQHYSFVGRQPKKISLIPVPIEGPINLALLPNIPQDIPVSKKPDFYPEGVPQNSREIRYSYSVSQWVSRFEWEDDNHPKKRNKTYRLGHINSTGQMRWSKGEQPWKPYKIDEALAFCAHKWLLAVEGEKVVEVVRENLQLVVITWQSSNWTETELVKGLELLKQGKAGGLIYVRDHDQTGIHKAQAIWEAAAKVQLPCILIEPTQIWAEMPDQGDLADWIDWALNQQQMKPQDLVSKIEIEIEIAQETRLLSPDIPTIEVIDEKNLKDLNWLQIAFDKLFGGQYWITVLGVMHCWNGRYYEAIDDVILTRKIAQHLDEFEVSTSKGAKTFITFPFAKPSCVRQVLLWAKQQTGVTVKQINPSGVNLKNGILQITWKPTSPGQTQSLVYSPSWCLVEHNPQYYYTYCSEAVYQPEADLSECDRLLAALEPPQQDIFLKLIGASLDLAKVRQYHGRNIRAILAQGTGSNGKDAFREVVKQLFGSKGITSCTLSDFQQYDAGRKFPLYPLGTNPKINWSSENTKYANIDSIQSLKQAITGDPLSIERKGKDETEIDPACILIFNINEPPKMTASLEAIKSRYAVLSFNKTFKTNPDPNQGELKADPRFKYSPLFIQQKILPAFLNKVLQGLHSLMLEGIDYSSTELAFAAIQRESDHLIAFCQEVGLDYLPNGLTPISEIWKRLQKWYKENGTLEIITLPDGEQKTIWHQQARSEDKTLKGANQVRSRFLELFPQAKVVPWQNKICISGIGFGNQNTSQEGRRK